MASATSKFMAEEWAQSLNKYAESLCHHPPFLLRRTSAPFDEKGRTIIRSPATQKIAVFGDTRENLKAYVNIIPSITKSELRQALH